MVPIDELQDLSSPRSGRLKIIAYSAGAVALVAIAVLATRPAPQRASDRMLPQFQLPRLDANGTYGSADVAGSAVVVNFWASWCGPCRDEMPLLEAAWREFRDQGLVVVGINVQDQEADAREFLGEIGTTFPMVRDADQDLARALDVFGLPQTFFVRRDGTLLGGAATDEATPSGGRRVVLGAISRAELEKAIEELLADG